jgi:hypothetical protein
MAEGYGALWIADLASWRYSDIKTPLDLTHEAATYRSMSRAMLAETLVETAGLYRAPNRSIYSHRKTTITIHLASGGTGALTPLVAGPDNRRNRVKTLLLAASAALTLTVGSAYADGDGGGDDHLREWALSVEQHDAQMAAAANQAHSAPYRVARPIVVNGSASNQAHPRPR